MAGFSLGGGRGDQEPTASGAGIPHDSLFLSAAAAAAARSSDVSSYTTRGFELWHQPLYPASSGLLSFASSSTSPSGGHHEHSAAHASRARGGSSGSGGGGVSCQDCGNQSKKDCAHLRCRTCCKSRGFPCPTHVKSTWVPAAKRRERQQQLAAAAAASAQHPSEASKRPRDTNTSAAAGALVVAAPATACGGGVMEGTVSFPAEVSSAAVFRCMRVSPLDEADEEFAYQTAVSIGGHVFKGILYDRGPDHHHQPPALATGLPSPSSASAAAISSGTAGGLGPTGTSAAGMLDPSSLYPAPISAFMAGTQFFPHHPRP